ncbi:hypothetical protein [Neomegalonema perideroedes]|uniref:hypothetical protein n=1 Tax=Neomegalonema perideroedes TaxID=217219 RepID=UPI0003715E75|nr:hypothetical protein [Neomegalonema perideroedes]
MTTSLLAQDDLAKTLARDPQGIVLRDLRRQLLEGRAVWTASRPGHGIDVAARAYDAALAALPDLWKAQQRSK